MVQDARYSKHLWERVGQVLNKEKSSIIFSPHTKAGDTNLVIQVSSICGSYERYLGLYAMAGRSKYNMFMCIKEKVWKMINSWKNNFQSQAGWEVLIKAILVYTMNVFRISWGLYKEISLLLATFWWGTSFQSNKIHWMSWIKLSNFKMAGSMSFKDFGCFNSTLLAKQLWRILIVPKSLVATIFKEKCFQYGNLTEAQVRENSSWIWKIMISVRDLLEAGIIWRIGNNTKITIWEDKWLPSPSSF